MEIMKLKSDQITYSSHDLSQTVSNTSRISDSGKGFPFRDGLFSSAFCKAWLIYEKTTTLRSKSNTNVNNKKDKYSDRRTTAKQNCMGNEKLLSCNC